MKSFILISLFLIGIITTYYGQDTTQMDVSQIPNEVGVLYEKAFIKIGDIARNSKIEIIEVKDLINDKVYKFIRVEFKTYQSTYSKLKTFSAALNKDETESLISAMDKIVTIVNNEKKYTYTEITFTTYEGLIVGAYYKKEEDKWYFYLEKNKTAYYSLFPLKIEQFTRMIILLRDALKHV